MTHKNIKFTLIISLVSALFGLLLCSVHQGWIIVRYPSYLKEIEAYRNQITAITKKNVQLSYWSDLTWHTEHIDLMWTPDTAKNIHYIITSWLSLLDEENITAIKVSLQTTLLSPSGKDVYLSFDRYPFSSESSTFEKWMWTEGLLKTLRSNCPDLQKVIFLVHHQHMTDHHLDFTSPWPIQGFLDK